MQNEFNGLGMNLGNLARLSHAKSRSISAENFTGEKGKAGMATTGSGAIAGRELGPGWKFSPSIHIPAKTVYSLAEIEGPGAINHIWLTVDPRFWRALVLRFYWDGEDTPSVEVPVGDFFCNGWCQRRSINSLAVTVNSAGGFNCYWEMPFQKQARITIENLLPEEVRDFYYTIDYVLTQVPEDTAYFHAQWRRNNPLPYKQVHTLLDGVQGQGQYIGTYLAWGVNNNGWWGEGELKFYLDGDNEWPSICGTGTEDYFGGAWAFEFPKGQYGPYSTAYQGFSPVINPDGLHNTQQRFGMYRWHIMDPIRFEQDLKVTVQALGWRSPRAGQPRYLALQDDIASTAFWYQTEPHAAFPALPDANGLEVI